VEVLAWISTRSQGVPTSQKKNIKRSKLAKNNQETDTPPSIRQGLHKNVKCRKLAMLRSIIGAKRDQSLALEASYAERNSARAIEKLAIAHAFIFSEVLHVRIACHPFVSFGNSLQMNVRGA
jgi:hypothetical protein